MKIKIANMKTIFLGMRGYFEISVFEILRVDCM